jgi:hypothetical protein
MRLASAYRAAPARRWPDVYAALAGLLARPDRSALEALPDSAEPETRRLALRVRNLGVGRFTVWAPGEAGLVLDTLHDEGTRCAGIDLGLTSTRKTGRPARPQRASNVVFPSRRDGAASRRQGRTLACARQHAQAPYCRPRPDGVPSRQSAVVPGRWVHADTRSWPAASRARVGTMATVGGDLECHPAASPRQRACEEITSTDPAGRDEATGCSGDGQAWTCSLRSFLAQQSPQFVKALNLFGLGKQKPVAVHGN